MSHCAIVVIVECLIRTRIVYFCIGLWDNAFLIRRLVRS